MYRFMYMYMEVIVQQLAVINVTLCVKVIATYIYKLNKKMSAVNSMPKPSTTPPPIPFLIPLIIIWSSWEDCIIA